MTTDASAYPSDLPSKPLVEAIFELRWALHSVQGSPPVDPGFRFLLGRYHERVQGVYPVLRELPAASIPEDMAAYVVRHQFRASAEGWPVTQLGPGILTVNETHGYTWESFKPRIIEAAHAVFEAYPRADGLPPFRPISVMLRYQNAMPFDPGMIAPRTFMREKLHTSLELDDDLFKGPGGVQEPATVNIGSVFPLADLPGEANLQLVSGKKDETPAIILDISVRSKGDSTPTESEGLKAWLGRAHSIAENWFFTLCRGDLREQFEKKP